MTIQISGSSTISYLHFYYFKLDFMLQYSVSEYSIEFLKLHFSKLSIANINNPHN